MYKNAVIYVQFFYHSITVQYNNITVLTILKIVNEHVKFRKYVITKFKHVFIYKNCLIRFHLKIKNFKNNNNKNKIIIICHIA